MSAMFPASRRCAETRSHNAHQWRVPSGDLPACLCGWYPVRPAGRQRPTHEDHVAAEQAKALREWLTSDETQVAVATALLREGRLMGTPTAMGGSVFAALADLIGGAR